jgi:Protein of unknown function (DUF3892)
MLVNTFMSGVKLPLHSRMKATTCVTLVTCITQTEHTSPYQRISHIGGTGWRFTQEQAVQGILNEQYVFYILKGGKAVALTIGLYEDIAYLKTAADGPQPNYLLRLPKCADEPINILKKMEIDNESLSEAFAVCPVYDI